MSSFAITIIAGIGIAAPPSIATADTGVAPSRSELSWETNGGDVCQRPDRTEPASTCKLLARMSVKGVGTFALYDVVSWHDLWITETGDDGTTRMLHVEAYGSLSSAGHERTPSHFVARARSFATVAGFELAFDFEDVSGHDGRRARSHERVFVACDDHGCRMMAFGNGPWVKHSCTTTGWTKSTTPRVAYVCTGETALD